MLDRGSILPKEVERKAGAYLPQFERRMAPHIVPEVEKLLQNVRNHHIARALVERTQPASPETAQLIQQGMFAPDFSMKDIAVYDESGKKVEKPEPYQVWEATKEMRTVMVSVIAGLLTDQMAAVVGGKNAYIWIPEERKMMGLGRRINAVNIAPRYFTGFGEFKTISDEPFKPKQAPAVSIASEYMHQVEHIIRNDWLLGQRLALHDVLRTIRGLDAKHPLRIMEGNLKKIVTYGLDPNHRFISREAKKDDSVHDFIDGGLGTQNLNMAALAELIPRLASHQRVPLAPDEFVRVLMNSVPLLRLGANGHVLFRVQALDRLKLPLSFQDESLLLKQKERGKIEKGERRVYKLFRLDPFTLEGTGENAHVALVQTKGKSSFDREEAYMRRLIYQVAATDDRIKLESPRVIARCPARQQRDEGKDDVITAQAKLLGGRLYQLNDLYRAEGLLL